jgi:DNA helicase-2/ATP-dependent DNA helicase PcrA
MTLSPQELDSLATEEGVFKSVRTEVAQQISRAESRLFAENRRARELTSQIHDTRRVEDKALLASDEAVSHGLKDSKREEVEALKKQLENPYFARISLEEDEANGATKVIEYKLGFSANPDLRIIDWRKAPISKLYYEYKEGDEYLEEILGRERSGKVILRNRIEAAKGALRTVQNRYGTFHWNPTSAAWEPTSGGVHRRKASDSHLPEILSLITPEQFRSITVDADTAILIQGVAGSGKTTVALHRLAWLLHNDNSPLTSDQCVFLVISPALKAYVANSLPSVGISGVPINTYHEWAGKIVKALTSEGGLIVNRPSSPIPASVLRVKRSLALLKALEGAPSKGDREGSVTLPDVKRFVINVMSDVRLVLSMDESRLITEECVRETAVWTKRNFDEGMYDWADDALLLRTCQLLCGMSPSQSSKLKPLGHVIVDEVQDLSPPELATIVASVKSPSDLTLVGDSAQNIEREGSFPGWEKLRRYWNFSGEMSRFVSLEVSHRSTLPIMRLADHIQGRSLVKSGRNGRVPIWFKCRSESQGIEYVLSWLGKAVELYPNAVTAVLCATPEEAKFAYKMLEPTFQAIVRLGDSASFSFEEGILVTDVGQVKGLEFFSVLLWNPTTKSYPPSEYGRNLLYVAATRAEENLAIVTWGRPSPILPHFGASKLVRSMDMTIKDEQTEES